MKIANRQYIVSVLNVEGQKADSPFTMVFPSRKKALAYIEDIKGCDWILSEVVAISDTIAEGRHVD